MYTPKDQQLFEVHQEFNNKLSRLKLHISSIELMFEKVIHNFEKTLEDNKTLMNENEFLKNQIQSLKSSSLSKSSPFIDEDKVEYTDEEDTVFNEWKDSFRRNLEIAAKIYNSWTPEQKVYNSIGYPKQNYDEIPDEYKSYYERD